MATYKQPCMQCKAMIERDARFCPSCGSNSPFNYLCPNCLRPIKKGDMVCSGCGRSTYTSCPSCKQNTFRQERCEACGADLMRNCQNPRCGVRQFFEIEKCTACGKKIDTKKKR